MLTLAIETKLSRLEKVGIYLNFSMIDIILVFLVEEFKQGIGLKLIE